MVAIDDYIKEYKEMLELRRQEIYALTGAIQALERLKKEVYNKNQEEKKE